MDLSFSATSDPGASDATLRLDRDPALGPAQDLTRTDRALGGLPSNGESLLGTGTTKTIGHTSRRGRSVGICSAAHGGDRKRTHKNFGEVQRDHHLLLRALLQAMRGDRSSRRIHEGTYSSPNARRLRGHLSPEVRILRDLLESERHGAPAPVCVPRAGWCASCDTA
ncbi:hypothetical protein ACFL5O_06325 [Myxococcota bacterium]